MLGFWYLFSFSPKIYGYGEEDNLKEYSKRMFKLCNNNFMKKNIYIQIFALPQTFLKNLKQMFPFDQLSWETLYFVLCLDLSSGFLNLDSGLKWLLGRHSVSKFEKTEELATLFSVLWSTLLSSSSSVTSWNPR